MNLWHQSDQTREIAQKQLSSLARAAGVMNLNDSSALHGRIVQAKVVYVDEQTATVGPGRPRTSEGLPGDAGATSTRRSSAPTRPRPWHRLLRPWRPGDDCKPPAGRGAAPPWAPQQA